MILEYEGKRYKVIRYGVPGEGELFLSTWLVILRAERYIPGHYEVPILEEI